MNLAALHRLFVGFTASLIAVSVLSDLLAVLLKKQSLRATAAWTLVYAAAITPFTVLAGYLWWDSFLLLNDQRRAMPHLWLGVGLAAVLVPMAVWRGRMLGRERLPGLAYLLAGAIVFGGSVLQSNMGRDAVIDTEQLAQLAAQCEEDEHAHSMPHSQSAPATAPATAPAQKYTCPMHPDVVSDKPGNCPKCGMNLVPVKKAP